uniref:Collagen IV NC1 domain-containing protein n=1 Tax=Steinernema glaseri TaxID=37863 RepID=A0A1I7ZK76_9BILA
MRDGNDGPSGQPGQPDQPGSSAFPIGPWAFCELHFLFLYKWLYWICFKWSPDNALAKCPKNRRTVNDSADVGESRSVHVMKCPDPEVPRWQVDDYGSVRTTSISCTWVRGFSLWFVQNGGLSSNDKLRLTTVDMTSTKVGHSTLARDFSRFSLTSLYRSFVVVRGSPSLLGSSAFSAVLDCFLDSLARLLFLCKSRVVTPRSADEQSHLRSELIPLVLWRTSRLVKH